jgi:hypothetical protein
MLRQLALDAAPGGDPPRRAGQRMQEAADLAQQGGRGVTATSGSNLTLR